MFSCCIIISGEMAAMESNRDEYLKTLKEILKKIGR
jgi:ethanolamine utilization microcompartment shell protein EutS